MSEAAKLTQADALNAELLAACQATMQRGSLSFFLAARLAGSRLRAALMVLYSWCRFCDDAVDQPPPGETNLARSLAVDELRRRTWAAMHRDLKTVTAHQLPVFTAFAWLTRHYRIPDHYPQELLAGMDMDVAEASYETLAELRLYCYRVAGTVGLMFTHVAGVSSERALRHAADLGMAMQLTNIARDVTTDLAMDRVYLPRQWLAAAGLTPAALKDPKQRRQLAAVVARLLDEADRYYTSGEAGLVYLPWRAALAAAAARFIYAEIGVILRRRGEFAWDERAVVPTSRKLYLVVRALGLVLRQRRWARRRPWQAVEVRSLWRFS